MVANLNNCLIRSLLTFLSHPQEKRSTQFVKRNLLDFVLGTGKKWWAGRSNSKSTRGWGMTQMFPLKLHVIRDRTLNSDFGLRVSDFYPVPAS
jgi:hypothetical protein